MQSPGTANSPAMTSAKQDFIEEVRRAGRERGDSVPIYDEHAYKYNEMYNGVRWQGPAHVAEKAASLLLEDFPEVLSRVLDFGCGTGLTGLQLRARGITKVYGLDPSAGMRAMIPKGTYVHMYQDVADLSSLSSRFAMIVSTAVIGTHVGPEVVAKLALSHLEPGGHMVFTLKVSYFNSPEFSEMFESLKMSGFAVQRSAGILLHTDDPLNEHTVVTISDQTEPRPTIMLWSTPRSMSTALERCVKDHPQVGTVMHDIMSGPEFGLTDPEIQGADFDGKTAATYEQVVRHVHRTIFEKQNSTVFIKTTARCASQVSRDKTYWSKPHFQHRFLVEHPEWVIPSVYARLDEGVQLARYHICYDSLASIIKAIGGPKPMAAQAADLRSSPTKIRTFLSNLTGLNVTELSLTWQPHDSPLWYRMGGGGNKSARVGTDGFRNYHDTVRDSSSFLSSRKIYDENATTNHVQAQMLKEVLPIYHEILAWISP